MIIKSEGRPIKFTNILSLNIYEEDGYYRLYDRRLNFFNET
jgi:hypothetical protein